MIFTRKILIYILLLFSITATVANQLTEREIKSAVTNWVRYITADNRPDAVIKELIPYVSSNDTVAYIANIEQGGFCICGAKNYMLPVYFYSPFASFSGDAEQEARYMLEAIAYGVKKLEKEQQGMIVNELIPERERYWRLLADGRIDEVMESMGFWGGPDSMSLKSVPYWDNRQWWPFDSLTPYLHSDFCKERTPDGCVAHSMSIILRYWQWPHVGVGSDCTIYHRKYAPNWASRPLPFNPFPATFDSTHCPWKGRLMWSAADGGKLMMRDEWDKGIYKMAKEAYDTSLTEPQESTYLATLDTLWEHDMSNDDTTYCEQFDTVHYRWDLMPHAYDSISTGDQKYAVARLAYDAGISIHIDYSSAGSGAFASAAAYEDHFNYDTDAEKDTSLARCDGPDTCNCPDDWHDLTPDTCNCAEPDTCEGAKAVVDDIKWLRPVQMGQGAYIHHAWMVLGYNRLPLPDEMQFKSTLAVATIDGIHYVPYWTTFSTHIIHYSIVRKIAPKDTIKFVGATSGDNDGSPGDPYYRIENAIADSADIPANATLIFKAGSDNTFSGSSITIDFPVILKSYDAVIRHE